MQIAFWISVKRNTLSLPLGKWELLATAVSTSRLPGEIVELLGRWRRGFQRGVRQMGGEPRIEYQSRFGRDAIRLPLGKWELLARGGR